MKNILSIFTLILLNMTSLYAQKSETSCLQRWFSKTEWFNHRIFKEISAWSFDIYQLGKELITKQNKLL